MALSVCPCPFVWAWLRLCRGACVCVRFHSLIIVLRPSSLSKLCSSVTAYCQASTLHPQGCHHVYTLVYTCPAALGLYLAVVNCCQVLRRLRAQHPLRCPSWLIWGGSAVCHSLALTCWTCPCGLVRKIVTMPKYKIQSQHQPFSQRKRGDIIPVSVKAQDWVFFCFHIQTPGSETKKKKNETIDRGAKRIRGVFFFYSRQAVFKRFFFFYVSLAMFCFHLTIEWIFKGCLSIPYC